MRATLLGLVLLVASAPAAGDIERPPILREVAFDQRIGTDLPLDLPFGQVVDDGMLGAHPPLRALSCHIRAITMWHAT